MKVQALWGVRARSNPDLCGTEEKLNTVKIQSECELGLLRSNQYVLETFPITLVNGFESALDLAFTLPDYIRFIEFWNQQVSL